MTYSIKKLPKQTLTHAKYNWFLLTFYGKLLILIQRFCQSNINIHFWIFWSRQYLVLVFFQKYRVKWGGLKRRNKEVFDHLQKSCLPPSPQNIKRCLRWEPLTKTFFEYYCYSRMKILNSCAYNKYENWAPRNNTQGYDLSKVAWQRILKFCWFQ